MNVIIKETGEVKELCSKDHRGIDYTTDFVGNAGGFVNGDFTYVKNFEVYMCSQDTYDWWKEVISDNERLEERIEELNKKYGKGEVERVLYSQIKVDLENNARKVHGWLDEVFGRN